MNAPAQKILVVEDENIVAMDLRTTLTRLGYEVVDTVGTGPQAIEQVEQRQPDLVLMDIQLRGYMDGIEAADRIRRLDVPVVYLTAFSDDATLRRARDTEPFGYVLKPFDDRELQIVIATGRRRSTTSCCGNRSRAPPSKRSIAGPGSWRTPASSCRSPWTSRSRSTRLPVLRSPIWPTGPRCTSAKGTASSWPACITRMGTKERSAKCCTATHSPPICPTPIPMSCAQAKRS